jgi:hypothetical protein
MDNTLEALVRRLTDTTLIEFNDRLERLEAFLSLGPRPGRSPSKVSGPLVRSKRKGRRMSAAARKVVSERMKKYWAARRAGAKK